MPGKLVTKTELAAIIGKTPKTLTIWQSEGLPHIPPEKAGDPVQYNTVQVIDWMIRRETKAGPDVNDERARLAQQQTESARLRNERAKGNLILLDDAKTVAERACNAIRQKIINCSMSHEDKQALLTDIHGLGAADFSAVDASGEEDDTTEDGSE